MVIKIQVEIQLKMVNIIMYIYAVPKWLQETWQLTEMADNSNNFHSMQINSASAKCLKEH
jgi:hypothetical protein